MTALRPDQEAARQAILAAWSTPMPDGSPCRRVLQQAPTAWGKGTLAAAMLAEAERAGVGAAFCAHLQEINSDLVERVRAAGVQRVRVLMGDRPEGHPDALVQIVSEQTVARRDLRLDGVRLFIRDEAHRQSSASALKVAASCDPGCLHLGLTATPERGDGRPLTFYQRLLAGPFPSALVAAGIIAPIVTYAPAQPREELAADPVECWPLRADGSPRPGIIFARSIGHSQELARRLREERGWSAIHCDADTPQRYLVVDRFNRGEIDIITNQRLLCEGVDVRRSEVTMLACSVGHPGPYLQAVGRSRRRCPGKERALLVDLTDNVSRLGLPDDERTYHLEGRAIRLAASSLPPVLQCPRCLAWGRAGRHCDACGWELPPPTPPRLSRREMVEVYHASQKREGEEWDRWVEWVTAGRAKGKTDQQIAAGWRFLKGHPPRYRVADVSVAAGEERAAG